MERLFQILAVILAGIAAYFLWQDNKDAAFVSGVLAACAYFLSMRFQIKKRLASSPQSSVRSPQSNKEEEDETRTSI